MDTTVKHVWAPQNLAAFTLFGLAGGALLFGLPGALLSGSVAGWAALVGAVSGVVVIAISVWVNFTTSGFLDGSPCEFSQRIETLIPLQYTCLDRDGPVALVLPTTIVLTVISLAGAVSMVWGLVALRKANAGIEPGRTDKVVVSLAWVVAAFLALDAVLGAVAVGRPGG